MRNDDFDAEDDTDESYLIEVTPKGSLEGLIAASNALPRLMLEQAMTAEEMTKFRHRQGITAIVEAPGAEWVNPLADAAKLMASWGLHLSASSRPKPTHDTSRDQAMRAIERGDRILGVSQNPAGYLPAGLAGAADIKVKCKLPDEKMIKRTIRSATGRYPRTMPRDLGRGLSFAEICFAIRKGSKPGECVARLLAAQRAKFSQDTDLAQAPPLASLHGYGEAMDWARGLVADLDAWRRGEIPFSALQRTAILASPPGMGKTTFVRSLAKAAGVPLVATSMSSWFSNSTGYLDGVIKQIDQVFQGAAAVAPAIVFLDEIEGIPNRANLSDRAAEWWMPVVGHILLTLDSANSDVSSKLIVIGATNFPDRLDSALTRPGRMSRIIRIGTPDRAALAGILRQHLGNDLAGEDLTEVAALGWGASGADVTEWVKLAKGDARKAGRAMTMADLLAQVAPHDGRAPEITHRIALHEAGHAVVMQVLGLREVESVSIVQGDGMGGSVTLSASESMMSKSEMEAMVTFALAGRCAEEAMLDSVSGGSGGSADSDLAKATRMVASAHTSLGLGDHLIYRGDPDEFRSLMAMDDRLVRAVEADLRRLYGNAMGIVLEYREAVQAVTRALLRERVLTGDRFREIFDRHPPGSKTIELDGRDG